MYYVGVADMVLLKPGADVFASHHIYVRPGTYCAGEMDVTGTPREWRVRARGNTLSYTHPECWLTSDCVVPGPPGCVVAFKVIQQLETLYVFKGKVMPLPLHHIQYLAPQAPSHTRISSPLESYLLVEATGVTVDAKMYHVLAMKARTWCFTHDVPIPTDLPRLLTRIINEAAGICSEAFHQLDTEAIQEHNELLDLKLPQPETVSVWRRWFTAPLRVAGKVVQQCAYVKLLGLASIDTLARASVGVVRYGIRTAIRGYAYGQHKPITWHTNTNAIVDAGTSIPDRCWENELASILTRALPPPLECHVHPKVVASAELIASMIGKVSTPMDFEEWLQRYPETRRKQLRAALERPLTSRVEFFHKVEQLDEEKDPRAIQARRDEYKARLGPWMAAFEERCKNTLPFLVKTLSDLERGEALADLRTRALNVVEIDFSRFDRHNHKLLMESTEHVVYEKVLPTHVVQLLAMQLTNTCQTRTGLTYHVHGTRMSGDMNTSIGNCIIVACLCHAAGIPLHAMKVEGDDMIACCTNEEVEALDLAIIEDTGHKPKIHIYPEGQGSFCSRYDIVDANGTPRRVRHPARDLRRFGFTLHAEDPDEAIMRHLREWDGVPMLGPLYRSIAEERDLIDGPAPHITHHARTHFYLQFGINAETQREFETRPETRAEIYERLCEAETGENPTGHCRRALQGATRAGNGGHKDLHLQARDNGDGQPRREGEHVRDVQAQRASPRVIQGGRRVHDPRPSVDGSGLRSHGRRPDLPSDSGSIAQSNVSSVAGHEPIDTTRPCNEAEVAVHGQRRATGNCLSGCGLPVRPETRDRSVRAPGLLNGDRKSRVPVGGVQPRVLLTPAADQDRECIIDEAAHRERGEQRHPNHEANDDKPHKQSRERDGGNTVRVVHRQAKRNTTQSTSSRRGGPTVDPEVRRHGLDNQSKRGPQRESGGRDLRSVPGDAGHQPRSRAAVPELPTNHSPGDSTPVVGAVGVTEPPRPPTVR